MSGRINHEAANRRAKVKDRRPEHKQKLKNAKKPATVKQRQYLRSLWDREARPMNDKDVDNLTLGEARIQIGAALQRLSRPT